jgi:16S rRNA (cytidine1402-2'-O)-methyltransferase
MEYVYSGEDKTMTGKLFLVSTPIGNLGDMTIRGLDTLRQVDFIAAEDTRVTIKLLNHFEISKPLVSYYEYNSRYSGEKILSRLLHGESCALVSDAGTPAISDPGEGLVRLCADAGVEVVSVPGACALAAALSVSGLPAQRFCFEGFLSTAKKSRRERLLSLRGEERAIVFYEAPHKLLKTLEDLLEVLGDRPAVICRELTKLYEEVLRMGLSETVEYFREHIPRGEFVLIVGGAPPAKSKSSEHEGIELLIRFRDAGLTPKEAIKLVEEETGIPRNQLYKLWVGHAGSGEALSVEKAQNPNASHDQCDD